MAKVEFYVYNVSSVDSGNQTIRLTNHDAWSLAMDIKRDIDPYGTWNSTDD